MFHITNSSSEHVLPGRPVVRAGVSSNRSALNSKISSRSQMRKLLNRSCYFKKIISEHIAACPGTFHSFKNQKNHFIITNATQIDLCAGTTSLS